MTTILSYPTEEDRAQVHNLIGSYAKGSMPRNDMMRAIAGIIEKYPRLQRIPVKNYSVRIIQYYGPDRLPVISIEGAGQSDICPCCNSGEDAARYLRTEKENLNLDYDLISVTCLECGCVYQTKGRNGRGQSYV